MSLHFLLFFPIPNWVIGSYKGGVNRLKGGVRKGLDVNMRNSVYLVVLQRGNSQVLFYKVVNAPLLVIAKEK